MNFARSFKALAGASGTAMNRSPRLTAALCIVFFVAVFGIAAYHMGAFVWVAFVPVTLCGVVNLWMLVTRGISDER